MPWHTTSTLFALSAVLILFGAACGSGSEGTSAPSEVTGVITEIDSEGLGEVDSFTLKEGDEIYEIRIDPERDYGFGLGHLHEHLQNIEPVRVELESRDGFLFALTIEDA